MQYFLYYRSYYVCMFAFAVTTFIGKPHKRRRTGGRNGVSICKKRYRIDTQTVNVHICDNSESVQIVDMLVPVVKIKHFLG